MIKRLLTAMAFALLALTSISGCYSTGKATGKAAGEVQEGTHEFHRGYEQGKQ